MEELKHSFAAVADTRTRVLLLGSLPGEESLARGQYYGNARNQFWRLMEEVIGGGLVPLGYAARLDALVAAGVGLWDVIESARRRGSLDGAIRGQRPNALAELASNLPRLRAIGFNGGKSASLGRPLLAPLPGLALIALPSSSPAFTLPFADKAAAWLVLRDYL